MRLLVLALAIVALAILGLNACVPSDDGGAPPYNPTAQQQHTQEKP